MELKKVSENIWKIEKTDKMQVPAFVYASEKLIQKIKEDRTILQIKNVATLKGIQTAAYAMPDAHEGFFITNCN